MVSYNKVKDFVHRNILIALYWLLLFYLLTFLIDDIFLPGLTAPMPPSYLKILFSITILHAGAKRFVAQMLLVQRLSTYYITLGCTLVHCLTLSEQPLLHFNFCMHLIILQKGNISPM